MPRRPKPLDPGQGPAAQSPQPADERAEHAIAAFLGPAKKKRSRPGPPTPERAAKLFEAAGTAALGDAPPRRPAELVALYGWLHREVYGVAPAELHGPAWVHAVVAARRMVEKQFDGDYALAVDFMRWTWARERDREKWRRENGRGGGRVGWPLQFSRGSLLTDYRVSRARGVG